MTDQIKEKLIYQQQEHDLEECPFFPKDDGRVRQVSGDEFEDPSGWLLSTACWRQYQSWWEIKDGRLFLNRIDGRYKLVGDEPIFADWFTGELSIPAGELLDANFCDGFFLEYSHQRSFGIEKGVVVSDVLTETTGHL